MWVLWVVIVGNITLSNENRLKERGYMYMEINGERMEAMIYQDGSKTRLKPRFRERGKARARKFGSDDLARWKQGFNLANDRRG